MKRLRALLFTISSLLFFSVLAKELNLETLYGTVTIKDDVIIELLESDGVQRMKAIDQSGIVRYFNLTPPFSRYDHSIGVYYLTRLFSDSLNEQIAALLHDVSHTAFSHLGDMIFDHDETKHSDSYQDSIHYWYLNKSDIKPILQKHNLSIMDVMHKQSDFNALEQPLPDICIDRLEYNLHTGYIYNLITKEDIKTILSDIKFNGDKWYFKSLAVAKKFASLSLHFTENLWAADWNNGIYRMTAQAFKRALNLKILTFDDLHFSNDLTVLEKVQKHKDPIIESIFKKCAEHEKYISQGTVTDHNFHIQPKFRGINPWIKVDSNYYRLTSLDHEFAKEYVRVKKKVRTGHYLNLDTDI